MAKDLTELKENHALVAVAQQATEATQTVTTASPELSINQVLNQAEIVQLVAALGDMESELEMRREERLELSV